MLACSQSSQTTINDNVGYAIAAKTIGTMQPARYFASSIEPNDGCAVGT